MERLVAFPQKNSSRVRRLYRDSHNTTLRQIDIAQFGFWQKQETISLFQFATYHQFVIKLSGHIDATESKHVVIGLNFLKYISDVLEERDQKLLAGARRGRSRRPDAYRASTDFWVPTEARFQAASCVPVFHP